MAYTVRKQAIKQMTSAIGNLDTALHHLLTVREAYKVEHPEHATAIEAVMSVVFTGQNLLEEVKRQW